MTPSPGLPSNYNISGSMPFGPGGNPLAGAAGGINGLAQQYGQGYNNALDQNKALYSNILQGYQQTLGNQVGAQGAIGQGYNQLYNTVLGGIQGVGQSQKQAIQDVYAQQSGQLGQSMISRGLGNTTIADAQQRGLTLDQQKAQIALANQMAQLQAGYQSNLGMAGLNYSNQANMQNTAEANQQLGWMNTVQAQYPHAQDYYGLYQQQGQWAQAQADRNLAAQLAQQGRAQVQYAQGVGSGSSGHSVDSSMMSPIGSGGRMSASSMSGPGDFSPTNPYAAAMAPDGYIPVPQQDPMAQDYSDPNLAAAFGDQQDPYQGFDFAGAPGANYSAADYSGYDDSQGYN